jgi:hypothetical protein
VDFDASLENEVDVISLTTRDEHFAVVEETTRWLEGNYHEPLQVRNDGFSQRVVLKTRVARAGHAVVKSWLCQAVKHAGCSGSSSYKSCGCFDFLH